MEILQYDFMVRALQVGLMVGILCPSIGLFLVLRRLSMVGDTLAHVSLAGVLIAVLWKINPLPLALGLSAVVSFLLERLRSIFKYYGELSLAVMMAAGLGTAVILMGITHASDAGISGLLFGSIITLGDQDVLVIKILTIVICFFISFFYRGLVYLTFDEEGARLAGIPVDFLRHMLILMAALVIALGLRIVGALLVSSLMVVPVATSLLLERGFKATLFWSIFFGLLAVFLGLSTSFYLDIAPGGTIIMASVFSFLIILLGKMFILKILEKIDFSSPGLFVTIIRNMKDKDDGYEQT